ncbi:MAG: aminomethyl-transferring glycine dehydrogenase [Actinomycetota bacterium]
MLLSPFVARPIGPSDADLSAMLATIGYGDMESLVADAVPAGIRWQDRLDMPEALDEADALADMADLAARNVRLRQMIGLGYSDCITPSVILRNVIENPAWYTAYTPYQPEISQGRLEALLAFQTLIEDLTALPVASASLLDEPTAAAEAMTLLHRTASTDGDVFLVDSDTHPQTLAVLATRAEPIGIELRMIDATAPLPDVDGAYGLLLSYPSSSGAVRDIRPAIESAHAAGIGVAVASDLLALTLLTPPGEMGADICVGSAQRFGVPLGFGGPHAGFMSVRAGLERSLPGRLVGVSVDVDGAPAYRLALQTREQHIRREKATSNICTSQVLLAVVAAMYAAYHGPEGLRDIAQRIHDRAATLGASLQGGGVRILHESFFDTVHADVPGRAAAIVEAARDAGINLRLVDADTVGISVDERTSDADVDAVLGAFGISRAGGVSRVPTSLARTSPYLAHPIFHAHRSETEMMRYLRSLSDKDLALDRTMIPLGSCTMKLNAATEMIPITWDGFTGIHPFVPLDQAGGYLELIRRLEAWLCEVTGYDAVSLQPNAGSQGEFAGLLAIRGYHRSRGEAQRDVCIIPSSAHGTNAASAVMAGMRVVVIGCDEHGNVDVDELKAKIAEHGEHLAALMITYPSTHGVYEEAVQEICALVHDAGGQVYVDGANLNALVGLAKPGKFGADVSHLNLHKTFCIPHGGGGPGVGPVAVRGHLAPFLPSHPLRPEAGPSGRGHVDGGTGPVSGAPWGSAGILPIPYAYIGMMGGEGLTRATSVALVSANYIARRLGDAFPVLYVGERGLVAHECIIDLRAITKETGVTVDDVAKRLIDFGIHAPTMSFPVAGTLMIEPTESEGLAEIDRFCDAMLAIRDEIDRVAAGEWPIDDSPLRNAPHTAESLLGEWDKPYPRRLGAYPLPEVVSRKYWPPVRRIDGAYGDRHLICSCPRPEELATT